MTQQNFYIYDTEEIAAAAIQQLNAYYNIPPSTPSVSSFPYIIDGEEKYLIAWDPLMEVVLGSPQLIDWP